MSPPVIHPDFALLIQGVDELKARSADFVSHMGQADHVCKPLKQSWGDAENSQAAQEYQRSWSRIVNGAVELSQTIDQLGRAVAAAKDIQEQQEKSSASRFPSAGGR